MKAGAFIRWIWSLEVRTPRGATKIAVPQAISGKVPCFLPDPYLM